MEEEAAVWYIVGRLSRTDRSVEKSGVETGPERKRKPEEEEREWKIKMQFPAAAPERPSLVRPESSDCFRTSTLLWGRREAKWRRIRVLPPLSSPLPVRPPATENKEKCWGGRLRRRQWPRRRLEVGEGRGEGEKLFFQALIPPKGGSRAEEGTILFSHV